MVHRRAARIRAQARRATRDAIRELLDKRKQTQPIGEWSCGSVFTNPPGDHAARLIESAGLKGFRIGDASVSEKHANFIINHGAARAADIEALIEHVQRTVAAVHGIELQHRSAHRRRAGMSLLILKPAGAARRIGRGFRQGGGAARRRFHASARSRC